MEGSVDFPECEMCFGLRSECAKELIRKRLGEEFLDYVEVAILEKIKGFPEDRELIKKSLTRTFCRRCKKGLLRLSLGERIDIYLMLHYPRHCNYGSDRKMSTFFITIKKKIEAYEESDKYLREIKDSLVA
jgi:hypothetical protein